MTDVVVTGAAGRMGKCVVKAVLAADELNLVGAIDAHAVGLDAGITAGVSAAGVTIESDLDALLARVKPQVMIDFTLPAVVMQNVRTALNHGVSPVIGTTGLSADQLEEIDRIARAAAIGAVLLMEFAARAARYMPDVEIIELHHDRKLDSPSGTALLTAQRIAAARRDAHVSARPLPEGLVEKAPGARGARNEATGDINVHSVRLPGFVAHQEVIFGDTGQILTLRHDSTDRESFMPGVVLAARKVRSLHGLVIGLEKLL